MAQAQASHTLDHDRSRYFVPHKSYWPILGATGLATLMVGFAELLNGRMALGRDIVIAAAAMFAGWFGTVIREGLAGAYNRQVNRSFRLGMAWFIFSEVMFFGAFFGALLFARVFSVPWLGGAASGETTHLVLWPHFKSLWPLLQVPDPTSFTAPRAAMEAWGMRIRSGGRRSSCGSTCRRSASAWGSRSPPRCSFSIQRRRTATCGTGSRSGSASNATSATRFNGSSWRSSSS